MMHRAPSPRTRAAFAVWLDAIKRDGTEPPAALAAALLAACDGDVERAIRELHLTQRAVTAPTHPAVGGTVWMVPPGPSREGQPPTYLVPVALVGPTMIRALSFAAPEQPRLVEVREGVSSTRPNSCSVDQEASHERYVDCRLR